MTLVEIGKLIEERRGQLSLRQEDLAEMSGVTVRTIRNIEQGNGNPAFATLKKLCEILGLQITVGIKKVN
jgi:transcriptional regulator with XRE-family HTH domain